MDLFNGLLDNTIGRIPGVSDSGAWNQVKSIVNIPLKIGTDLADMQIKMMKSMMNMGLNLQNVAGKVANGLADTLSSPLLTYGVIGGLVIGGIYVLESAGSGGGGGGGFLPSNAQTLATLASFTPMGKAARLL